MKIFTSAFFLYFCLFSTSWSDVGDVYYCETNIFNETKQNKVKKFKNEKFKFLRNINSIKFGDDGGFLANSELDIILFQVAERFRARDNEGNTMLAYNNNIFFISSTWHDRIVAMTGKCSVFK